MTGYVVSLVKGFVNRTTGQTMYKVFVRLEDNSVGYFYRDEKLLPLEGDTVTFSITTDKDCRLKVRVN